jgi:hypothetical protein
MILNVFKFLEGVVTAEIFKNGKRLDSAMSIVKTKS